MKDSFYLYNSGELKRKDNTVRLERNDGSKRNVPIEQVSDIYAMSEISINTSALNILSQYEIVVHFFNYYDFYIGSFYPRENLLAGNLVVKQSELYLDEKRRLDLAQRFILAASSNIYRNLRYYNGRGKDTKSAMEKIIEYQKMIKKTKSIQELMGVEGNIRKVYYSTWNIIINEDIEFNKRVMHPPDNMINSLISYVNSLIYTTVLCQIYQTQLNPTISYLHEPGVRRFSLCLDLAEIFKPVIGDRIIFSLLNKKQITEKSFTKQLNYLHLTREGSEVIMHKLDEYLHKTIFHKELQKDVSYKYLIRLEAYKLIKHILGEKEYEGFEIWW